MDNTGYLLNLEYDQWAPLPIVGPHPPARYKHAAAVINEKLYVIGGSRNGRYLSDVQVFDFHSLTWCIEHLRTEPPVPTVSEEHLFATSGHVMVEWGNKLLILSGHVKKNESFLVKFIEPESRLCGILETTGRVPVAREGHSATLFGSKLIVFGGEDRRRGLWNDVHTLDLEAMVWERLETVGTPPAPRFDHSAAMHGDRYLIIFGGCSHSIFFGDLHVLDLHTKEWSQPEIRGDMVTSRAGHAGVTIGENWYLVGGGDSKHGCVETSMLDMPKLVWNTIASVKERHPLASEGLSVCPALIGGDKYLVAFGGYNGKYQNEIFVMKPKPRDSVRPKILQSPAAAAAAASVTAAFALTNMEKPDVGGIENLAEIDAVREEKRVIELSLKDVKDEVASLREKVDEVNGAHAELSKELLSVQGQLVAERSRCFKLEAQIEELHKILESLPALESEVQALRKQKSKFEQDLELAEAVTRQNSGGFLSWLSGSS
ncbi:hypothetical protein MLD38_008618 [Melastoma candidum]|uniref:Uncharacterized protein n=1 Tax=Melastoma candidum TaxID=119954 RepID=A0ACB9RW66_9MYRT|nr:hypothetical protein MLD38_008618 [Melastoma candidum]